MTKNIQQHRTKLPLLIILLLGSIVNIFAQKQTDILIGEKVPDISFTRLVNHTTKTAKLSDFAGKLVIIDFWNTGCSPCIKAFPKLDSLQKQFGDKIQIIAVAPESESVIADFLTRIKKIRKIDISFPFETDNRQLESLFKHMYVPHEVWIGPDGIVKATTQEVSAEDITNVLNGNTSTLTMKTDREFREADWSRPLEIKRLGKVLYENDRTGQDTSLRYISVLTKRINNVQGRTSFPALEPRARIINGGINILYALAYGLQTKNRVIPYSRVRFENIDPEIYTPPTDISLVDEWKVKNTYSYEVNFPEYYHLYPKGITTAMQDALAKEMGEIMQKDLARFFGYQAGFEKRKEKSLVLFVTDSTKLITRGGKLNFDVAPGFLGMSFTNAPMDRIASELAFYLRPRIFVNETGYTGNIDLEINAKLTDWVGVSKELAAYGLALKEEERMIDILVIRNKK